MNKRIIKGIVVFVLIGLVFNGTVSTYGDEVEVEVEETTESDSKEVEVKEENDSSNKKTNKHKSSINSTTSKANSKKRNNNYKVNQQKNNEIQNTDDIENENDKNDENELVESGKTEGKVSTNRKSIKDIDVYISSSGVRHFNGKLQKWKPVIKYRKTKLTENVDYYVSYDTDNFIDAQVIHVTVRGIGSYKGTVIITYRILPKIITYSARSLSKEVGKDDPDQTYSLNYKRDVFKKKLMIAREKGEEKGDYLVIITGPILSDDHNYIAKYKNAKFSIE